MQMNLNLDWQDAFGGEQGCSTGEEADIPSSLVLSLRNRGCVDMGYMRELTGAGEDEIAEALSGSIFRDPESGCWVAADEYLSGKLDCKLATAESAELEHPGKFRANIDALLEALPKRIQAEDIFATLGSPWIPVDVIGDFIAYLFKDKHHPCRVKHDAMTASWTIENKGRKLYRVPNTVTWGTKRCSALEILEDSLNGRDVKVYDRVADPTKKSGYRMQANRTETLAALEKQSRLIGEFEVWLWSDRAREERLVGIFNDMFGYNVIRRFDGGFLELPGLSPEVELRGYQKDAVARILMTPNTLLAHDVGSGKTLVMAAAAMEKRRILGTSQKNLIVVPNNVLGQWAGMFRSLYPKADILVVAPGGFGTEARQAVLEDIRDGDRDAVIMAQSSFDLLALSRRVEVDELADRLQSLEEALKEEGRATTAVKNERARLRKKLEEMMEEGIRGGDAGVCFDELGVTGLFVDEAHTYKNIPAAGSGSRILGLGSGSSGKCRHMLRAVRCVQKANPDGGGVVFATGTPVTNSIADCFVMQHYLQGGTLALLGLGTFSAWVGTFAERRTEFEIDVDTSSYRLATRLSRFNNLPELEALLCSFADFHSADGQDGIPAFDGYEDVVTPCTAGLRDYLVDIAARADQVRHGRARERDGKRDNLLWITSDGRMAALDPRLVGIDGTDPRATKVHACAERVAAVYREGAGASCAQLVLCDSSTPKEGFNVYDELKRMLTGEFGIPAAEVAFVHGASSEKARAALFAKVRSGEVRVLVGSTAKLGIGVNVQERLAAMHHLDVPWRPADMTQREGRILRQGNVCGKVRIFRYVAEGSFDAYSYQLLQTKAAFVSALLSGCYEGRSMAGDIGERALSYSEVKALAVGDPTLRERVELDNELQKMLVLWRRACAGRADVSAMREDAAQRMSAVEGRIPQVEDDIRRYGRAKRDGGGAKGKLLRRSICSAVAGNAWEKAEAAVRLGGEDGPEATYCGFYVILPAGMDPERPYIWLEGFGRYRVELGENKEQGVISRMHNVLEGLPKLLGDLKDTMNRLAEDEKSLLQEYSTGTGYLRREIERIRRRIAVIDYDLEENRKD